ncbi:histone-lysine N-methyltransferase ASHR1-like isoform X1 [Zingiber officinale]|uniref:histone-lysine N-methyltransferase ASHR1-like isoform X1 n=2 Tax=Zingiber officinale TaxID=94328 RepID=UPI001C4DB1DC|nr:histone-lysine N-methyltransferase ASHR1-like isoform X1 [Zingiber officinale]
MENLQRALESRGLALASIPGKGRGLVTTRDFVPGDVIIFQEPYASAPNKVYTSSICDGCFTSNNLRKCSACKVAWYCGNTCQRSEWKLHQLECKALASLRDDRRKLLTSTVRLMVRLILKKQLQNEQVIPTTAMDSYNLVATLESHISNINEEQLVLYAQMANLIKLVLPSLDVDLKEITHNFSKLSCNAHTICDDELRPLGTGLYPVISMINHSCVPNSILMFEYRMGFVRATEPITKGTEILISYIETAATTATRKKDLKQYFFTCTCARCTKNLHEELEETAILEGFRCRDNQCNGFLILASDNQSFTCQKCGIFRDMQDIEKISSEISLLEGKTSSLMSSGYISEAKNVYKIVEQLQLKLCHPYSLNLLRTRENLLKVLMELKDWKDALAYCCMTIPIYERIYPAIHPMIGLEFYIRGKLEWLVELTEDSIKSFIKAIEILRITHGTRTPFMKELLNKLEEARAEASHKHSVSD